MQQQQQQQHPRCLSSPGPSPSSRVRSTDFASCATNSPLPASQPAALPLVANHQFENTTRDHTLYFLTLYPTHRGPDLNSDFFQLKNSTFAASSISFSGPIRNPAISQHVISISISTSSRDDRFFHAERSSSHGAQITCKGLRSPPTVSAADPAVE